MKKYINSIVSIYEDKRSIDLYKYWLNHNALYYMKYFTILALAITSLLIPFDYILYKSPYTYSSARVILMTLYILQLIFILISNILCLVGYHRICYLHFPIKKSLYAENILVWWW